MSERNGRVPAIDSWCNPFTELGIRTIFTENPEVAFMMGDQWGRHDRMRWSTPSEFIEIMDAIGVEKVCIPSLKMMQYRTRVMLADIPHEHIAELIAFAPDRFVGLAGISPISGMEGVRALERAVREYGFKGAHVHPFGFGIPLNEREWWPFYTKCAELDIPVMFQAGHSAEFMPSACGKPILLDDIAIWFPELRLVGGHTGWPWTEELIAMAWKHPNVYIGVSGHAPKYWDPKLVRFLNARRRGIGKVMWGTDYPLIGHAESLEQIDALDLKPEARYALLRGTALDVFKLEDTLAPATVDVAETEREATA
jgi:predicted TIM-barrel fold metal-dependent hydrolase